ncbi:MAG: 1,6-anhydro-N-acetylmuramyl-L-alanine amidase AmpD [Betaproteobacteria bacterium]|nr:1,6-anhydro-N-acetylmuramyl-L-alanine amidase AmpD [Betaproteobacteria bacterium]
MDSEVDVVPPRFRVDIAGMCSGARWMPSPNHDQRPDDAHVELLVVHNISLPPGEFGGEWITDLFLDRLHPGAHPYFAGLAGLRVSSHFLVRREGEVIQYVPCERRAWHAGASSWKGRDRCNDFSVGIELEGTDYLPFTDAQYASLGELSQALFARYGALGIAGHSDIAPGRKTDPGPHFDWARYRAAIGA